MYASVMAGNNRKYAFSCTNAVVDEFMAGPSKRRKLNIEIENDVDNLWEDIPDECFIEQACQVVDCASQQESDFDMWEGQDWEPEMEPQTSNSRTSVTSPGADALKAEIEALRTAHNNLKEESEARKGEVSILRTQLQQKEALLDKERMNGIQQLSDCQRQYADDEARLKKELASLKTELIFKNKEVEDLRHNSQRKSAGATFIDPCVSMKRTSGDNFPSRQSFTAKQIKIATVDAPVQTDEVPSVSSYKWAPPHFDAKYVSQEVFSHMNQLNSLSCGDAQQDLAELNSSVAVSLAVDRNCLDNKVHSVKKVVKYLHQCLLDCKHQQMEISRDTMKICESDVQNVIHALFSLKTLSSSIKLEDTEQQESIINVIGQWFDVLCDNMSRLAETAIQLGLQTICHVFTKNDLTKNSVLVLKSKIHDLSKHSLSTSTLIEILHVLHVTSQISGLKIWCSGTESCTIKSMRTVILQHAENISSPSEREHVSAATYKWLDAGIAAGQSPFTNLNPCTCLSEVQKLLMSLLFLGMQWLKSEDCDKGDLGHPVHQLCFDNFRNGLLLLNSISSNSHAKPQYDIFMQKYGWFLLNVQYYIDDLKLTSDEKAIINELKDVDVDSNDSQNCYSEDMLQ